MESRSEQILNTIIDHYIQTAEPVGSRSISKKLPVSLSAATIRNVMSDLTDSGFLSQPHTSAGRVPTDLAYRHYVDRLQANPTPELVDLEAEEEQFAELAKRCPRLEDLLQETANELTQATHCVGMLLPPRSGPSRLKKVELLGISQTQVLVILVTQTGMVKNRILPLKECPPQEDLDKIAGILCGQFAGQSIEEIHLNFLERLTDDAKELSAQAIRIGKKALEIEAAGEVYVSGSANLCEYPEFFDHHSLYKVYRQFENKEALASMFEALTKTEGLHVQIGGENRAFGLESCSVLASTYGTQGALLGGIALVGPTRIDYPKVIEAIGRSSRKLSYAVNHFLIEGR
ncbi:MAG: heat-inducible transcription repressor HrcA [Candidatus Lambdaproteobacteria bacterium RIFOXYD1_FULL_56_27]|uniref:Heat-inducible transcription repressor HrcA n=1 Tax=Candidatus Lambdaproteobacteria bacterium RIFOXYD2_FULL_56_26 TaxID=1817773 RepID=A0A1F6GPN3_9PROT|nr:MAG: heat-inducible transcription repressor HrcA [Candidatus Lambdaproteobacteria bacterium RIFOXYD2_FULL_56_26]OGH03930.1 MAG: heat-inducible transcription repressor HrcA [Candidatus Lambdaproteobacteria bacterium RIFOXYC1_FULL_56_13]OGH06187.1 MAG: heat-inducible transcription repressor HrcA [Candidatus Lambdaproteobacteria bacterium RIFOXYD1_FULL_56_27]